MNKVEYAQYLGRLIGEPEIDTNEDSLQDQFYGYFQCFMPSGEGVEQVFAPLPSGEEILKRLLPIYKATEVKTKELFAQDLAPGYFCPQPTATIDALKTYGKQHIEELKGFARFIEDAELLELLSAVNQIDVVSEFDSAKKDNLNSYLYDAVSDWAGEFFYNEEADNELFNVLREAFYSISCDYYLAYYLQYPAITNKPESDFLLPYFNIWQAGYRCKFDGKKLVIYS